MRRSSTCPTLRGAVAFTAILTSVTSCKVELTADDWCSDPNTVVANIVVEPPELSLSVGENTRLVMFPSDAQGRTLLCVDLPPIVWSTTDPSVATVADGLVEGRGVGKAVIRATVGEKSDSTMVTVVAAPGVVALRAE